MVIFPSDFFKKEKKEEKKVKEKKEEKKPEDQKEAIKSNELNLINLTGKAMVLVLDSGNFGRIVHGHVEEGFFTDQKTGLSWFVGAQQPIFIRTRFGYTPMYIVRFDSPFPSENVHPVLPEFLKDIDEEERKTLPTPKLLRRLLDMVILANVLRPKRKFRLDVASLIIGAVIGAFIFWYLRLFGVI